MIIDMSIWHGGWLCSGLSGFPRSVEAVDGGALKTRFCNETRGFPSSSLVSLFLPLSQAPFLPLVGRDENVHRARLECGPASSTVSPLSRPTCTA